MLAGLLYRFMLTVPYFICDDLRRPREVSEKINFRTASYTVTAFEQLQYRLIIHNGHLVIKILLPVTPVYF